MIRVLIVENENDIAHNLHVYLAHSGFLADHAYDGESALKQLQAETYDAILLDLGLPKRDGIEVLRRVRHELNIDTPVIIISGRITEHDKVNAFETGADDYLTKPFSMAELVARIRSHVLRAQGLRVSHKMQCGAITYVPSNQRIYINDQDIHLPPKALKLLVILMNHANHIVNKATLEHALWPDGEIDPYGLRGQIHILRKTLNEHGLDYLETQHGVGYRLRDTN